MKRIIAALSLLLCVTSYADVKKVKTEKELDDILKKNKSVIVKFGAPWCGHCKIAAQPYKELSNEVKETLVDVDGDESSDLVRKYGITGYPTFKRFDNGKETAESGGFSNKANLKKALRLTDKGGATTAASEQEMVPSVKTKTPESSKPTKQPWWSSR